MHIRSLSLFLFNQLKKPFFLPGLLFGAGLIGLLAQKPSFTQAEVISLPDTPETIERVVNGPVNSIAIDDAGNSYIGGNFSRHGLNVPYRLVLNTDTEEIDVEYPRFNNNVSVVISDGSGGWYVGGEFTQVDSENRNYLIHILADKSVDLNWSPNPNGTVRALRLDGNTLYVGGYFTNIAGESRNYIAAFNAPTGALLAWDPGITNTAPLSPSVSTIDVDSDAVYFGGGFSHVDGSSRYSVASANKTTADLTPWNPNPDSIIYDLLIDDAIIYIGGQYSNIGGVVRSKLAAVNNTDGTATAFDPNPDQTVYSLFLENDILYVGGAFDTIGGETRYGLAAVDINTSTVTAFETGGTDAVTIRGSMLLSEGILYVGGDDLGTFGGAERVGFAAVDVSTGIATDLDLGLDNIAVAFAKNGSDLFVGGTYKVIDSVARKNILSLDSSQSLRAWNPNADSTIHAIRLSDNLVYVGGEFSEVGGELRNYIAALDPTTGLATAWNPNADSTVYDLLAANEVLYVGGEFSEVGGELRNYIAALDPTTGLATAWNPNADSTVYDLLAANEVLYVGGEFSEVGGELRNYIAALDPTTGLATAWNPNADSTVYDLLAANEVLYVGGDFETIGGESRSHLAELDFSTGLAGSWNPDLDNTVQTMAVYNNSFFAGGLFNYAGDFHSPYLAMFIEPTIESTPAPSVLPTPNPENITPPQCTASTPSAPDLFQVVPGVNSVRLFFTSVSDSQEYFISYSTEPAAELHGTTISLTGTGVQTHTINYLRTGTVYYFKVRGQNGCMPGEWSEIYGVRTLSFGSVFERDFSPIGSSGQPPTPLPDVGGDDSLPIGKVEEVLQEISLDNIFETRLNPALPFVLGIKEYFAFLGKNQLLEYLGPVSIALGTMFLAGISILVPLLQVGRKHASQVLLHILHGLGVLQYKNPQGIVYDARTNEPVPFALLTIRSANNVHGMQIQETVVTDTAGAYRGVELPQGNYSLTTSHQDFSFPTQQQRPKFLTMEQHYRGEVFAATANKQQLYIVPLDKLTQVPFVKNLKNSLTRFLEKFSLLHTFWPLFGISILLFSFYPGILNGVALSLQGFVVVKKVVKSLKKPPISGVVVDLLDKPIANALVRITTQSGSFVALVSSDSRGRYFADIPRDEYQISVLKTGYVWQQAGLSMTLQTIDIKNSNKKLIIRLTPISELYSSVFKL